jgi:hypothetical protein
MVNLPTFMNIIEGYSPQLLSQSEAIKIIAGDFYAPGT